MIVHRGQIWENDNEPNRYGVPSGITVFVCGVQDDEWVWYVHLLNEWNVDGDRPTWRKARMGDFVKKFKFTNMVIAKRSYWKKKATGDIIQIIGIKDDGWKQIRIYYDLNKIDIHYFFHFFMPASKEETLSAIARDLNTPKNMKKMKRRLEMIKGDPTEPVTYE